MKKIIFFIVVVVVVVVLAVTHNGKLCASVVHKATLYQPVTYNIGYT
jgi:hypothetical protein